MAQSVFIVSPSTQEIIPYQFQPTDTFQLIITDLQNQAKPANLIYYNGYQNIPLRADYQIAHFLPFRQNQIIIYALPTEKSQIGPILDVPQGYILTLILSPDLKQLIPYYALPTDTISKITNFIQTNYQLTISVVKYQADQQIDLIDQPIGQILPWRISQILLVGKNLSPLIKQLSLEQLPNETIFAILLNLPVADIVHVCQASTTLAQFCATEALWQQVIKRDFALELNLSDWPNQRLTDIYQYLMLTPPYKMLEDGAQTGNLNLVNYALNRGADNYYQALELAAEAGQIEIVKILLAKIATLKMRKEQRLDYYGQAALNATKGNHLDVLLLLLPLMQQNITHGFQELVLEIWEQAGATGSQELIQALIDYYLTGGRMQYDFYQRYINHTLGEVAKRGDQQLVNWLLTQDANGYGWALEQAARGGHQTIVKQMLALLQKDPQQPYYRANLEVNLSKALSAAAKSGNLATFNLIWKVIQQYQLAVPYGNLLENAVKSGHQPMIDFILRSFAKQLAQNNYNEAMKLAAKQGNLKLVQLFLQRGADNYNETMETAAEHGWLEIVKLMVDRVSPVSATRVFLHDYNSTMVAGARQGNLEIVQLMLTKGATSYQETFKAATEAGNLDIVKLIWQVMQKKNIIPDYDQALAEAAGAGNKDVVLWLIKQGAEDYQLALENAVAGRQREMAQMMIDIMIERGIQPDYAAAMDQAENDFYFWLKKLQEQAHSAT